MNHMQYAVTRKRKKEYHTGYGVTDGGKSNCDDLSATSKAAQVRPHSRECYGRRSSRFGAADLHGLTRMSEPERVMALLSRLVVGGSNGPEGPRGQTRDRECMTLRRIMSMRQSHRPGQA